jgi:pimeloyl-ACP methyl ester carboxylesterase
VKWLLPIRLLSSSLLPESVLVPALALASHVVYVSFTAVMLAELLVLRSGTLFSSTNSSSDARTTLMQQQLSETTIYKWSQQNTWMSSLLGWSRNPGALHAYISTLRHFPFHSLHDAWTTIGNSSSSSSTGRSEVPTLLVLGRNDPLIPYDETLRTILDQWQIHSSSLRLQVLTLENATHTGVFTHTREVTHGILRLLAQPTATSSN